MKSMNLFAVVVVLVAFAATAQSSSGNRRLPRGWKLPLPVENSGCDRTKSDLLTAKADFDGDKKADEARLLVKEDGQGLGVWVWLAARKAPLLVAEFAHRDGKHDIGISRVGPGTYETACGKGHWGCKTNEPPKLRLGNAGLDVFTCESANQLVYWDTKSKDFKSVWMSD